MMTFMASPSNQLQSYLVSGMPVLVSFANWRKWMDDYMSTYSHLLLDSGAYSVINSGATIDIHRYKDWYQRWEGTAVAIAGLDDISGDWKKSLAHYKHGGFPTIHSTDPPELLPELLSIAQERNNWLGIGIKPPRQGHRVWLEKILSRIPKSIHVHGWALRSYQDMGGFDSMDSTSWWTTAYAVKKKFPYLTYAECLEIVIKKYKRQSVSESEDTLFGEEEL